MRSVTAAWVGLGGVFLGASLVMGDAREAWRFRDDRLENGLRVLSLEDHHVPIVNVQVWYHVGSKDENPARQGFAHMFEHMMFRGSDRIGPQDHFKYLQRYGAQVNGYTSFDQTVYWQTLPAAQLDVVLWLEAERMGRLRIDEEYFAAEREVVKEELRMRVLNRPYGSLREQLHAAAFDVHPYQWTPIGRLDHLNAATAGELRTFFKTFYTPNNATLVVVGDIRHEEVLAKARQYLGPVARAADPPRVTAVEPPMTAPKRVEMTDKAPAPLAACVYHTPSAVDRDSVCADLLSGILGSGQSSRLYRRLVQGREIAVSASAYNHAMEQAGLLVINATLKPGVTVEEGEKAIREEIKLLLEKGIDSCELEKARNQEIANYVRSGETVQGRAGQLGYAAVILGDVNRVNTDLDRLRGVTIDEVMAMARRVLRDNNCLTLLVRPEAKKATDQEVADKSGGRQEPVLDWPRPQDMPQGQAPKPIEIPLPLTDRLENGLEILVVPDRSTPAVTVSFSTLIGAREDPDEMAGLAYVVVNTLRRGTTRHTGDQLAERLDFHAISLAENTDYEDVSLRLWTLTEHLDLAVETLAEIVREPTFPQKEVAGYVARSAARRAIEEKDPSTVADRSAAREVFGDYFLARPIEGDSASLGKIDREAVVGFHKRCFAPDVSALVFSGDIALDRATALARRWFGDWTGKAERRRYAPPQVGPRTHIVVVDQPDAAQSEIRVGQIVPLSRRDRDYPAARLVSQILGSSFGSRLNRVLRIEKGLTYGARGNFDNKSEAARLHITTFTRTDRAAEAVRLVLGEVARINRPSDMSREELDQARDTLVGSFQVDLETSARVAAMHWNLRVWGLPPTWYQEYLARLATITDPAELTAAAARIIDPSGLTIVVVGRGDELAPALSGIAPTARSNR
ncbi:MAG TPA: pitrilysin family protein [Phycisphaerae bacterium]|nr:pitrilysin family protein [Phycisphaerae bacterium]